MDTYTNGLFRFLLVYSPLSPLIFCVFFFIFLTFRLIYP